MKIHTHSNRLVVTDEMMHEFPIRMYVPQGRDAAPDVGVVAASYAYSDDSSSSRALGWRDRAPPGSRLAPTAFDVGFKFLQISLHP